MPFLCKRQRPAPCTLYRSPFLTVQPFLLHSALLCHFVQACAEQNRSKVSAERTVKLGVVRCCDFLPCTQLCLCPSDSTYSPFMSCTQVPHMSCSADALQLCQKGPSKPIALVWLKPTSFSANGTQGSDVTGSMSSCLCLPNPSDQVPMNSWRRLLA